MNGNKGVRGQFFSLQRGYHLLLEEIRALAEYLGVHLSLHDWRGRLLFSAGQLSHLCQMKEKGNPVCQHLCRKWLAGLPGEGVYRHTCPMGLQVLAVGVALSREKEMLYVLVRSPGAPDYPVAEGIPPVTPGGEQDERLSRFLQRVVKVAVEVAGQIERLRQQGEIFLSLYNLSRRVQVSLKLEQAARTVLQELLNMGLGGGGTVSLVKGEEERELCRLPEGFDPAAVQLRLPVFLDEEEKLVLAISPLEKFLPEDEKMVRVLATGLELALRNIYLYDQLQSQARMLREMLELRQAISSSLVLDEILKHITEGVKYLLGEVRCAIYLRREESDWFELAMVHGKPVAPGRREISLSGTRLEPVLNGQTVVLTDLRPGDCPTLKKSTGSLIVVPMSAGGMVVGMIEVFSAKPRVFSALEVEYMELMVTQAALAVENARQHSKLQSQYLAVVHSLVAAIEAKDVYTLGHSRRTAELAQAVARRVGLPEKQVENVRLAALLHDVGKIGVREQVLLKPSSLSPEEYEEVKRHPELGVHILKPSGLPQEVIEAVYHHHENWDGSGYPGGLAGRSIPILARILRVVDSYDAMVGTRPYRPAMPAESAKREIQRLAGIHYDPVVVRAFLQAVKPELSSHT